MPLWAETGNARSGCLEGIRAGAGRSEEDGMSEYEKKEEILLTRKLIGIESSNPGVYETAMADFVYNWFRTNTGAEVIREPVAEGRDNIVARLPGRSGDHDLTYICHMDTMPVGEGWEQPPLEGKIIGDRLYGRGACDMKSGLAAGMLAFRDIAQRGAPLRYGFQFIATVNEEDAMTGSKQTVKDGFVNERSYVLDAEPTGGSIQMAHKGKTWFTLHTHGKAAHASMPQLGCDAVAAMAEILTRINRKLKDLPVHPEMGPSTAVFGAIRGGLDTNIVPAECMAYVDMRLVPPVTNRQSIALVREAVAEGLAEVPGAACDFEITAQWPALEKNEDSFLLEQLRGAVVRTTGSSFPERFFPGYTDTAVIAALTGNRNCISCGPGSLDYAHKPNEFVPCGDIIRARKILTALAESILL